jgi:hypothetical protein
MVGERVRDLLEVLTYNIKHQREPRYTRFVFNTEIDPRFVPLLIRDMTEQAQVLADSFEDALSNPEATIRPSHVAKDARRVGMGFFLIDEPTLVTPATGVPAKSVQQRRKTG